MTDITELALRLKLEAHRAVSNFNPQMNIKTRDMMELVEAMEKAQQRIIELVARKEKRLPVPYAYLRESDGQIQISIGAERPSDRSGGYATPWFPIYTAAGIKVEAE
ncbi:TPA: hypothetical protein R0E54_004554 [Klebsiella pneumoniae]|nr:hypothetical protein [Klebsiella pneumoniae]HEB5084183.1 hypothetical protein [Klebsiella pneumoniae]